MGSSAIEPPFFAQVVQSLARLGYVATGDDADAGPLAAAGCRCTPHCDHVI
jgi:hypothetical protein